MNMVDGLLQDARVCDGHLGNRTENVLAGMSVVVPLGPGEQAWRLLLADLAALSSGAEVLLVATDAEPADLNALAAASGLRCRVRWIISGRGRARQMNLGARCATRHYLWFLHADSRLGPAALAALDRSLVIAPDALHYFDLMFQNDGPTLTRCSAWGVQFRSRFLGLPFGDQGFCLSRERFLQLGGFDEQAVYGEDHLLVWTARRQGIPIRPVGASIATSARKYQAHGWLRTTLRNAWLTWRQAVPEWWKWVRSRCP